jgi:hypothetical protein
MPMHPFPLTAADLVSPAGERKKTDTNRRLCRRLAAAA